ncbi:helix-turn-helix transcriptional regulator [Desulfosporosinus sp. OT]|uniref:helix-turn-helix domain-containing protein n=1 Tax=Desulfosporosinus sp. OT TaxID=913865 RepID=UPI000223A516|nr:helix-turn-helix transcriptional regulator [Desulfosporosinus sp. OT]EGW36446.1 hypothetical protein DOT_5699 [Desulfosporosinus sp. OT]
MFQITFRAARIASGYTIEQVASHCSVESNTIKRFENDCTEMPIDLACKVSKLYNISLDDLFIGKQKEGIR